MARLSFHENGIHFGALRVSAGQDSSKRSRKYPRWLFVALNLILVLLAGIAILFSLYLSDLFTPSAFFGEKRELQYTLEIYDADAVIDVTALEGAEVIDAQSGTVIGNVLAVSSRSLDVLLPDFKNGETTSTEVQRTVLTLTVSTTARYKQGDGYYVDDIRLAMNQNYLVSVGDYTGKGSCVTLTVSTEGESLS